MVRFYAICVDAFPETPALKEVLTKAGFQRSELICAGAFTTATMTSMISGTVGSRIIPGGIGAETSYRPHFLDWRYSDNSNHCLTDVVTSSGKDLIIHNHLPWMAQNIVGQPLSKDQLNQHYRDHSIRLTGEVERFRFGIKTIQNGVTYYSTHPDLTLATFVEWGHPEKKSQFYRNERMFFEHIQDHFNGLLWTDLCHWHEAVYYPEGNPYHKSNKLPVSLDQALTDPIEW